MSKWVEIKVSIGRINVEALINLVKEMLDLEKYPEKHIAENGQGGLMGERGSYKRKKKPDDNIGLFSADTNWIILRQ
ncbi:hypothetical protein [Geotalea toluenoxydans]|uniref:hypothetical protein n=1 Tax=Geotalea toluenoxydans TaxID=421624 RepID=UPI0006CF237E|nr:hypothetical protein [Geotalea toluenoxydans]